MDALQKLKATVEALRSPTGCPWDREQTHRSLARCLVEESAELLDTIEREDFAHMREELGDVLLQVVYHAILAEEKGRFSLDDVIEDINAKLVRRHPHVFGEESLADSAAVLARWDEIKKAEKNGREEHIPPQLSGLLFAKETIKRLDKAEMRDPAARPNPVLSSNENDVAALLFDVVRHCRAQGWDAESLLREYSRRQLDGSPSQPRVER